MPLGSSSLAPVINPGPSSCRKPIGPLRLASLTVVRPALGRWAPGLTTERIGSGLGCPESGAAIERYIRPITKHGHRRVPAILTSGITWRPPARCNNELQGLVSGQRH